MKRVLIFIYLCVLPVLGLAQPRQFNNQPKLPGCGGCSVVLDKKQTVRIGYDNHNAYQYLTIAPKSNESIQAVERVIFEYSRVGFRVYAYIPKIGENLDKKLLRQLGDTIVTKKTKGKDKVSTDSTKRDQTDNPEKLVPKSAGKTRVDSTSSNDPNATTKKITNDGGKTRSDNAGTKQLGGTSKTSHQKQEKVSIQLYVVESFSDSTNISKSNKIAGKFKRTNRSQLSPAELEMELDKIIMYQDLYPNTRKALRDIYRTYKQPKWYLEAGGLTGLSYRTIQVVNPLPDRATYQSRLRDDKAQFSGSVGIRAGFNFNTNNSLYGGLLYLHQRLQSVGKIDWNTGLASTGASSLAIKDLDYRGGEVGYSYSPFNKKNGLSVDLGFHFLWANNANTIHQFTWGPNIAIGPKIRVGARADLRIMPTIYYNIRSLEKHQPGAPQQELATRMFSTGLRINMRWNY